MVEIVANIVTGNTRKLIWTGADGVRHTETLSATDDWQKLVGVSVAPVRNTSAPVKASPVKAASAPAKSVPKAPKKRR